MAGRQRARKITLMIFSAPTLLLGCRRCDFGAGLEIHRCGCAERGQTTWRGREEHSVARAVTLIWGPRPPKDRGEDCADPGPRDTNRSDTIFSVADQLPDGLRADIQNEVNRLLPLLKAAGWTVASIQLESASSGGVKRRLSFRAKSSTGKSVHSTCTENGLPARLTFFLASK